ncbi:helix-turn-helix domain-containing protein [Blautia hydrogenotrophica]|jgi:transcriptional regulator with XRE-family HTH domain|uniref:HTH cro/C1-type domain-containing protein n=2 Tax=Blautia hydrogenotrophica TaxID=53443 RepID=C0CRV1_BLAHS|nr:helix-turn-helix transcriptional regulator [Blautia hydrogenotrophica]EEG47521.1 DNA-binding helix-turn-helix protein [Blautia hydrogenotrophica DSM 10507]MCT6798515.1 helix-turn-helix transcriptional regulator [Blautia hydrogenotrophica]
MKNSKNTVGKEVRRMRIDRIKLVSELTRQDMTQKRLAELSGVSRVTINYIKGGKSCSDEVGQKIAKALGVDVTEIIETEE